ncbi:MAG: TetR/AcrR family transcriptional regulator [Actinobacteria bacterium]|nr:MAG: TetR/AcrR family transcriptional regulator [Actinomycetota bacterium]
MAGETTQSRRRSPRSKHDAILEAAIQAFGRDGYEDSKWADVAKSVGIGSTALYHYFESKLHCLYVIMADTLEARLAQFEADTREVSDYPATLERVLRGGFELSDQEVLCNRVLIAEQALLAVHRTSPREEEARQRARARTRDLEFAWATFLSRAMEQGAIPEADPRLLTRAVLGLHNSVWHWYRTGGDLTLAQVADFFVARCLAILGLPTPTPATATSRRRAA